MTIDSVPFENAEGTPKKGKYTKYAVDITELSGLCLSQDKSFLCCDFSHALKNC